MKDSEPTIDSLSMWLQDELDGVDTPTHRQLSAHITDCPMCLQRLDALKRVEQVAAGLVSAEVAAQRQDSSWLDRLMGNLVLETRAGRSVPLSAEFDVDTLSITEGAILAAIRGAADSMQNLMIGKCRLIGDIDKADSSIEIYASATVRFGVVIEEVADRLRELITAEVQRVSELNITAINIEILDVFGSPQEAGE